METVSKATPTHAGVLGAAEAAFESAKSDLDRLTAALTLDGSPTQEEREASIKRIEDTIGLYQHVLEGLRSSEGDREEIKAAAE